MPSLARGGEKLTLIVDEAVGGKQFEGVDLKQDSVEQKVVSGRTELGFMTQTRLGELLQRATQHKRHSVLWIWLPASFTTKLYKIPEWDSE